MLEYVNQKFALQVNLTGHQRTCFYIPYGRQIFKIFLQYSISSLAEIILIGSSCFFPIVCPFAISDWGERKKRNSNIYEK